MYLEIKDLKKQDLINLGQIFPNNQVRHIYSMYAEIAKIEAECSIENILSDLDTNPLTKEQYNAILKQATEEICDISENNAFQTIAEDADNIVRGIIKDMLIIKGEEDE